MKTWLKNKRSKLQPISPPAGYLVTSNPIQDIADMPFNPGRIVPMAPGVPSQQSTSYILAENNDILTAENGDRLIQ